MSMYRSCGPTALGSRASWAPPSAPADAWAPPAAPPSPPRARRPLSEQYDRIFNVFERTNAFEYVKNTFEGETRHTGHDTVVVNRRPSSWERAHGSLAAHAPPPVPDDTRDKALYAQARQLYPLQEDLADWISKTIGITYLTGENFLEVLDNGAELCQLAQVIHARAREALHQGLIVGPVPSIRGRCWERAARRSFFSRDNTENFIRFCRDLGVHENLLFESDDLVLHNQPRQVILCLLELARLATRFGVEPPGLVALEKEIALEEQDSGLHSADSTGWQFRDATPPPQQQQLSLTEPSPSQDINDTQLSVPDSVEVESTKSEGTVDSSDLDVPLRPTNELDKRVQLVTRLMERGCSCGDGKCSKLLKVKKVGEGRYNIAGRNVFIRLLKGRHMMVRVGGGWDTLEHFLSRHEPCQVRLVTQGRRGDVLPVPLEPSPTPEPRKPSPEPGKHTPEPRKHTPEPRKHTPEPRKLSPASSKESSLGTASPIDSKASSLSGKTSPIGRKSGKISPAERRTSTPTRPASARSMRSALTLPLNKDTDKPARTRKQSAPSLSTPNTPAGRTKTPTNENRKPATAVPKKSRSMSLALVAQKEEKKPFSGTDRLHQTKRSASLASTPTEAPRAIRSQSLAGTPVGDKKPFCGTERLNAAKKTRSMSLASPITAKPMGRSASLAGAGVTQAAIEESIRLSLAAAAGLTDHAPKPFLHIKAKYRSPPPREVPPR